MRPRPTALRRVAPEAFAHLARARTSSKSCPRITHQLPHCARVQADATASIRSISNVRHSAARDAELDEPYTGQRIEFRKEEAHRIAVDHVVSATGI